MAGETFYETIIGQGISRRDFMKFCAVMGVTMGLSPEEAKAMERALMEKPRIPVLWIHGLECTCCSESFIRAAHPLAQDILLSMVSLDYDDTLMASAGYQAEAILDEYASDYEGDFLLAVEGNPPLLDGGVPCIIGGRPFIDRLRELGRRAKAIVSWGTCASFGCVQAARPNPTHAVPVSDVIRNRPIINVPGYPPIAEVMVGVLSYILTFNRIPELDRQLRPTMFYGKRVHDTCYRRAHFDAGQFVEAWDDEGARQGWCLYKMGCRGPTTYNACTSIGWNDGVSNPIKSGHGRIGCSEKNFFDRDPFYKRVPDVELFGVEANAETIGVGALAGLGVAVTAHAAATVAQNALHKKDRENDEGESDHE